MILISGMKNGQNQIRSTIDNDETVTSIRYPETGYLAFYIDLKHKSPSGSEYTQSTRMFVADTATYMAEMNVITM